MVDGNTKTIIITLIILFINFIFQTNLPNSNDYNILIEYLLSCNVSPSLTTVYIYPFSTAVI